MAVVTSIPIIYATEESVSKYTRLHVTPLNPTLLPSILPSPMLTAARNISYHTLQTFPEKEFGFIDLPSMEAQKLKKKLNGSILKGEKVKIEDARPSKKKSANGDEDGDATARIIEKIHLGESSKKRKRDSESLHGIELRDRKVKRGWTDPGASKKLDRKLRGKKDVVKSKYTSGPELLFRTTIPANKASSTTKVADSKTERRKKPKGSKEVVVHEFSKTTKHASFLRSSAIPSTTKGVAEYVENKGWVDASGNIVEGPIEKSKKRVISDAEVGTESIVNSIVDEGSETDETTEEEDKEPKTTNRAAAIDDSTTSSSGTSEEENEEVDGDLSSESETESVKGGANLSERSPKTPPSLRIGIPNTTDSAFPNSTVHPLEALFKRRRPNLEAPIIPDAVPSFSFFDVDGEDGEEKNKDSIPMTPFTKQDFASRGLRSAAPTPDTAFPSKSYNLWSTDKPSKEHSTDIEDETTPIQNSKVIEPDSTKDSTDTTTSDFQKWFYEHRGENNRAWKRRRKLVAKEKRHKENKKRNERLD